MAGFVAGLPCPKKGQIWPKEQAVSFIKKGLILKNAK